MKKVMVLGTGVQGSTTARRLDEDDLVSEIICADYNMDAVNALVATLHKAKGARCDANDTQMIIDLAKGADLVVNALPLDFGKNVLDAALAVKADYQDFASTNAFDEDLVAGWIRGMKHQLEVYGPKFAEIGKTAVIGTGSAPGLICCATRYAMRYLDSCDTIYNFVWEGVEAKRFMPFWWSPETAMEDMSEPAYVFENGEIGYRPAFEDPVVRQYDYMDKPVVFYNHCHDEPVQYSFSAGKYFKGCKNAYFKYAGVGMDYVRPLSRAGLLSHKEEVINGRKVVPFDLILKHIPTPPSRPEDIQEILDEGLVADDGCMVAEAYGKRDGKDVVVEAHVFAPGMVESFEKAKMTGEMYLTGQSGYLYSKLLLEDVIEEPGLITSDMLSDKAVDRYFEMAKEFGITVEVKIREV